MVGRETAMMRLVKGRKQKNSTIEDGIWYDQYHFNRRDWGEFVLYMLLKGVAICYLFYDTWKMCWLLVPLVVVDYRRIKKEKLLKQKRELAIQFKAMVETVSNSLSAGYSLEKAFVEAQRDLRLVYSERDMIFLELKGLLTGIQMNIPIEQLLANFGMRSGVDDIANFANVVTVAKKSGGNLVRIIQKTMNSISDKLAVEEEIETMIAAKKYEQKIMMIMPYGIIFYLRVTDTTYFDVLYHNIFGIFVMTVFLSVIQIADLWAKKIMEIQV